MLADMGNGGVTWIFLHITSILIVLAAAFGAINYLFFKLPSAIGILVVSQLASLGMVVIDALLPDMGIADTVRTTVTWVDFSQVMLEGMLGLLLFAGALHVKLSDLQKQWSLVLLMATLGVALSALVFGVGAHLMFGLPLLVALLFGSLISQTDPVAVLDVLRPSLCLFCCCNGAKNFPMALSLL